MTRPGDFDAVLSQCSVLGLNVKRTGPSAAKADCPCCGHKTQEGHLSLTNKGDRCLAKCHNRHTYGEITAALGFKSLTYSSNGHIPERREVAHYDYPDEDGKLLYQVVRFEPKGFQQRRPDGNNDWIWNLKDMRRVIYRLPEVCAAVKAKKTVYVVEGEKDADNGRKLGLICTTAPSGAGKWHTEYSESLAGAEVVVIPDNDKPGKTHAQQVVDSLRPHAASVHVAHIPSEVDGLPVKDLSDWIAAGGTREAIQELLESVPEHDKPTKSLVCMADVEAETVKWLWRPYIPLGKLTLLEGDPGIGKSWVSLAIARAISLGEALPGTESAEPQSVLLASAEDGLEDTIRPRLDALRADVTKIHAITEPLDFGQGGLAILKAHIATVQPALVIIDPLVAYIGAGVDLHRSNETRVVMAKLADIAHARNCAILVLRHLTKGGTSKPIYRGLGSIDIAAAVRSVLMAGCDPAEPQKRGIVPTKNNLAPMGPAIGYELKDTQFSWTGESDLTAAMILAADDGEARSALKDAEDFLREVLADGLVEAKQVESDAEKQDISPRTLRRARKGLHVSVTRQGETGKQGAGRWMWSLPEDLGGQECLHGQDGPREKSGHLNQNSFENRQEAMMVGHLNAAPSVDRKASRRVSPL